MIAVRDLTKSYAGFPALKGVSFTVPEGTVVGFLGPNGAGKTTTLRILSGFMPATDGTAEILGFNVADRSRDVRRRTGYLPEDVPLYRDMTVDAYLAYLGGLKEIPAREIPQEVDRVVEITGLEPVRGRHLAKCSRGYRQRAGLAQALLGDPPVLLLDEPTSGLDPNQVAEVRELIRELGGRKTVLLSSHILSEVTQICARVLIVHEGRLVAEGTPEELARKFGTGHQVRLRVDGGVSSASLEAVPGVRRVTSGQEDGEYLISVADAGVVPAVARVVVGTGADLLELRPESVDLEAVFRSVTGGTVDA